MSTSGTLTPVNEFTASTPQVQSGSDVLSADVNSQAQVAENRATYLKDRAILSNGSNANPATTAWSAVGTYTYNANTNTTLQFNNSNAGDEFLIDFSAYANNSDPGGLAELQLYVSENGGTHNAITGAGLAIPPSSQGQVSFTARYTCAASGSILFLVKGRVATAGAITVGFHYFLRGERRRP